MTPEVKEIFDRRKKRNPENLVFPSSASLLAEAGRDIYTIGKRSGHSTVQMNAHYAHLGPGAMQEAVKRLPSLNTWDQADQKGLLQ
jgi:integrase